MSAPLPYNQNARETTPPAALSVAICTYNRATSLEQTLTSLCQLDPPLGGDWELMLVDNNSTDHTRAVAESFTGRLPLRYLFEPEQGLSAARNRALGECRGDLLIFTDDDVILDRAWLASYARASGYWPGAGFLGGRIKPLWHDNRPGWLLDDDMPLLGGLLVHYDLGQEDRLYTTQEPTPFGASFALQRVLFQQLSPFRTELGVKGSIPGRGEEADYLERARSAGFRGGYVGSALCYHAVDPRRLTLRYLYGYGIQKGIASIRMDGDHGHFSRGRELLYGIRGMYQLCKGRGDRFRQCVINMGIQRGARWAIGEANIGRG